MRKSFLYRWFGLGACPGRVKAALEVEGLVCFDEGVSGWFLTRRLSAPGKRLRYRADGFLGTLALTRQRFVLYAFRKRKINILLTDNRLLSMDFETPAPDRLTVAFEASLFRDDWKGRLEFKLKTPLAAEFMRAMDAARAGLTA